MSDTTHLRKGTLWKTWCGLVPDQVDARIGEFYEVTCMDCVTERAKMDQVDDTLERAECEFAGHAGHQLCGFCPEHQEPRAVCQCTGPLTVPTHDWT